MFKRFNIGIGLLLTLSIFILACGREDRTASPESKAPAAQASSPSVVGEARAASEAGDAAPAPAPTTDNVAPTNGDVSPTTGEEYRLQFEKRLNDMDAKIGELRVRARTAGPEMKEEFNNAVDDLGRKRAAASRALTKMRDAGDGKWEEIRPEADSTMSDLERSYEDVASRFR